MKINQFREKSAKRGLNKSGKLPTYQRGLTVYVDWRTAFHFHSAWRAQERLLDWQHDRLDGVTESAVAVWFRYFQCWLISMSHTQPKTVFIPKFKEPKETTE